MPSREKGLSFRPPRPPRPRTVLRVPGSHTLYVGPQSCMRRHALGHRKHAEPGTASFLRVEQADVISGCYERLIEEAVSELVRNLAPSVLFINLFCIDDFLGTDTDSLATWLSAQWPQTRFVFDRVHPVALDGKTTMSASKGANLYAFLEPVEPDRRDRGVNLVGSFVPLNPRSEFFSLLDAWGMGPIRQLFDCKTFDDYQDMARSRVTVVTRFNGRQGALDMQRRLHIPSFSFEPCYDPRQMEGLYRDLAVLLGQDPPDCGAWMRDVREKTARARAALGPTPLVVDSEATLAPFALARALLDEGFNVTHVLHSHHAFNADEADRTLLKQRYPHVLCIASNDPRLHMADRFRATLPADRTAVAVGTASARIAQTDRLVDMWHDEGHTGFHGIGLLMEQIERACARDGGPQPREGGPHA